MKDSAIAIPAQTASMLQYRSVGNRVVEYGFGIAKNNESCFFICSSVFSIQPPAEAVNLLVQVRGRTGAATGCWFLFLTGEDWERHAKAQNSSKSFPLPAPLPFPATFQNSVDLPKLASWTSKIILNGKWVSWVHGGGRAHLLPRLSCILRPQDISTTTSMAGWACWVGGDSLDCQIGSAVHQCQTGGSSTSRFDFSGSQKPVVSWRPQILG